MPDRHPADHEPDTYLDDLGRTVFTEAYHLRRGYCCDNGCKHCPYRNRNPNPGTGNTRRDQ